MKPPSVSVRIAVAVVRLWSRVYTIGLPAERRERRRAEIESDIWQHCHDSRESAADSFAIVGRLLRGLRDDLGWRLTAIGPDSRAARLAIATTLGIAIVVSSVWLLMMRDLGVPRPPAPPDLITRRVNYPPPPPPLPPPCNPPGIGRAPFTPCTPYRP
jgi:hypothetical protein